MKLYLDNKNRIMAVNNTDRTDLKEVLVDENDEFFQFAGWSETRICCYKINYEYPQIGTETQIDENEETIEVPVYSEFATITMMTPYVPTHMMSALDNLETRSTSLETDNIQLKEDNALLTECVLEISSILYSE